MSGLPTSQQSGSEWISVSDLMSGLMLVFMAIAIFFMSKVQKNMELLKEQNKQVESISQEYLNARSDLVEDIQKNLGENLNNWNARFDSQRLSIVFVNDGRAYFRPGDASPSPLFRERLDAFFPKLVQILERHQDHIVEVRIEGHTDPNWTGEGDPYIMNMRLSQGRARNVLAYVKHMPAVSDNWSWLQPVLTANGLSFSQAFDGDDDTSRRVEFRILTDAAAQLDEIRLILGESP